MIDVTDLLIEEIEAVKSEIISYKRTVVYYKIALNNGQFYLITFILKKRWPRYRIKYIFVEEIDSDEYLDLE